MARPVRSAYDRLMERVTLDADTGCLMVSGRLAPTGYSVVNVLVTEGKWVPTCGHRVVWEHTHGPLPEGSDVHHTCGNRPCVNLHHLERVERRDHAEHHARENAKLTADDVAEIRSLHPAVSMRELGRRYGVHHKTIRAALEGRAAVKPS